MARVYDNYSSLIDFTRASSGTALRPISYGDELVTNGTFDSDLTGWNNSASIPMDTFELSSGRLHIVNTSGLAQAAYTDDTISLVAGRVYQFSADLEKVGGTDDWDIDIRTAAQSTVRHTMTIYATTEKLVVNFYPTVTENVVIQITTRSAFEGYADNISIREVLFDQPNGTLTLFNHPTNIPRIEYDADGNRLGLLVEESRTNLVDYSEDFSGWNKTAGGAVTQNQALAPDGTLTADEIVGVVYKTPNLSTGTRCLSAYLKANAGTTAQVRFDTPTSNRVVVDLTDGSIVFTSGDSIDSYGVTYIGNGWYRCHIVITDVVNNYVIVAEANDANHTVYVWGAQLEQASFPTSYIPTSGSTATRSADVASIGVSEFGYNQSEGTLFVEYVGTKDTFAGVAALQVDASTVTDLSLIHI